MVVNGACKYKDMDHFEKYLNDFDGDVAMEYLEDRQLVALQGPAAPRVLERLVSCGTDITKLAFMEGTEADLNGVTCHVTRCGYTGEDGYEISIPFDRTVEVVGAIDSEPEVQVAGAYQKPCSEPFHVPIAAYKTCSRLYY